MRKILTLSTLVATAIITGTLSMGYHSKTTPQAQSGASAIFAGGCFWCVESDFDKLPGVVATTSGYAGGHLDNPTYKSVTRGNSGHYEVVKVDYDPSRVSYDKLLEVFWHSVDPTDDGGQFCDRGQSYQTAIIALNEQQRYAALNSKQQLLNAGYDIATPVLPAATFFPAEDYHQDYYLKNPVRYKYYRYSCGRNQQVQRVWGDMAYKGLPK
ncbi:MAG: peptide-methionine (S)-S-oxide reductase MsrA [Alphaproteobacteria bacterium]